ncbi:unnamed protein product, partial [Effrenium voratum]
RCWIDSGLRCGLWCCCPPETWPCRPLARSLGSSASSRASAARCRAARRLCGCNWR